MNEVDSPELPRPHCANEAARTGGGTIGGRRRPSHARARRPRAVIAHDGEADISTSSGPASERTDGTLAPHHYDLRAFHAVARWAEVKYGLSPPKPSGKPKLLDNRDGKAVYGRGIDRVELRKAILGAWNKPRRRSSSRAALLAMEALLLKGDRRDYALDVESYTA